MDLVHEILDLLFNAALVVYVIVSTKKADSLQAQINQLSARMTKLTKIAQSV